MAGGDTCDNIAVRFGSGPNTGESWAENERGERYSIGVHDIGGGMPSAKLVPCKCEPRKLWASQMVRR
jgi:hypothetical protein